MPDYVAGFLLALGLVLPVGIAAIATLWERESALGTPLWGKVMMVALLVLSLAYFVGIAVYGNGRYANHWDINNLYPYYWFIGVIAGAVAIGLLESAYGRKTTSHTR